MVAICKTFLFYFGFLTVTLKWELTWGSAAHKSSLLASGALNLRKLLRLSRTTRELKLHDHTHYSNTCVGLGSYLKLILYPALDVEKIVLDCSHAHREQAPCSTPADMRDTTSFQCLGLKWKRNPMLEVKRVCWANNTGRRGAKRVEDKPNNFLPCMEVWEE